MPQGKATTRDSDEAITPIHVILKGDTVFYRSRKFAKVQKLLFYEPSASGAYHDEALTFPARPYQGLILADYLARRDRLRKTHELEAKRALSRDMVVAVPMHGSTVRDVVGSDVTLLTGKLFHYKLRWEKSEVSMTIENTPIKNLFRCRRGSKTDGDIFFLGTESALAEFKKSSSAGYKSAASAFVRRAKRALDKDPTTKHDPRHYWAESRTLYRLDKHTSSEVSGMFVRMGLRGVSLGEGKLHGDVTCLVETGPFKVITIQTRSGPELSDTLTPLHTREKKFTEITTTVTSFVAEALNEVLNGRPLKQFVHLTASDLTYSSHGRHKSLTQVAAALRRSSSDGKKGKKSKTTGGSRATAHPSHSAHRAKDDAAAAAADSSSSVVTKPVQAHTMAGCMQYKKFVECYDPDYKPPAWVFNECSDLLARYGQTAIALYPAGTNLTHVKQLIDQREPTNMANPTPNLEEKQYDAKKLQKYFGYAEGRYRELSHNGTVLPPQVAVACTTPIVAHPGDEPNSRAALGEHKVVNVVSIIGLAFDHPRQPDVRYFRDASGALLIDRLKRAMTQAYLLAFAATAAMGKSILVPAPIGDMAFRPQHEYPDPSGQNRFIADFVVPAIAKANEAFPQITAEPLARFIMPLNSIASGERARTTFTVPECFFMPDGGKYNMSQADLLKRVFINAWDCWSALGNGNFHDRSADGSWGRSTAILLLGWPRSNPNLRYEAAPTPDSEPETSGAAGSATAPALRTCALKHKNGYLAVEKGKLVLSNTKYDFYFDPNATGGGSLLYIGGPHSDTTLKVVPPTLPQVAAVRTSSAKDAVQVLVRRVSPDGGSDALYALKASNKYSGPDAYMDQYHKKVPQLYWYFGEKGTDAPKENQLFRMLL